MAADLQAELLKSLRKPDVFRYWSKEEEQQHFESWSFQFRTWLHAFDANFKQELDMVEGALDRPISMDRSPADTLARGLQLYALLSTYVEGRSGQLVRAERGSSNGFEVWRQLVRANAPRTRQRSLALMQAIVQMSEFQSLREGIAQLDDLRDQYERTSGKQVDDELLVSTLVRCSPQRLRTHVQLRLEPTTTYEELRELLLMHRRPISRTALSSMAVVWCPWTHSVSTKGKAKARARANRTKAIRRVVTKATRVSKAHRKGKAKVKEEIKAKALARLQAVARAKEMCPATNAGIAGRRAIGKQNAIRKRMTCELWITPQLNLRPNLLLQFQGQRRRQVQFSE